jgi:hypothetical protein
MADPALHRPRRRALPALAALLASAALAGAPAAATAAPGLSLTALSPASWWQADGTFKVPLTLQLGELISIDRLEIEVVGLPGILDVPAPAGPVSVLENLAIDLPGVAGTRTIKVTAWVVGQPSYGAGPVSETVTAQTVVTLAPPVSPGSQPGGTTGPSVVSPISNPTNAPLLTTRVAAPKVLLLRIQTIKGKRYAFVKSSAAVRLELVTNRKVGRKWKAAKRVRTNLVAKKIRRVPLARLAPGQYQLKAVVRDKGGRTGTRIVKLSVRVAAGR